MTTKNLIINKKFMFIFFLLINHLFSQEDSAQHVLEKIYKKNKIQDGYYDGIISVLIPHKDKEVFEFSMLKKEVSVFWDVKQNEKMKFRVLCKNEFKEIYIYDRLRDTLKKYQQQDVLKTWIHMPVFLFCNPPLELLIDPLRKEYDKEIVVYGNFFIPYAKYSLIIHTTIEYQIKKMIIFRKHHNVDQIEFRIFAIYEQPISILKKNQIEPLKTEYPTEIEIINAKNRSVVKIQWLYYHSEYKMDDIRFMPEFISR